MICVALQESNVEKCLQILKTVEMAEIRIDLAKLSKHDVEVIFSKSPCPLIATCRPDNHSDAERMELLKAAIASGATYVDIEIESTEAFTKEMVAFAKEHNTTVIISYHNYELTPSSDDLQKIVDGCFASGADIAKIAAMVNSVQDNARLMNIYNTDKKVVILGMGQIGKVSRIMATYLGSPFTFAALNDESATAPGQITAAELLQIQNRINSL